MKKLLLMMIFSFMISISVANANYYDDNPDYYFFMKVQGWKHYINLKSIDVQEYNPPHYQIKGQFVSIGYLHNEGQSGEYYKTIRYNWYTKEAFQYENGNWHKMCQDSPGTTFYEVERLTANALFRAAYGMNFYGY